MTRVPIGYGYNVPKSLSKFNVKNDCANFNKCPPNMYIKYHGFTFLNGISFLCFVEYQILG
jgi:hypothetical protein